MIDIFLLQAPVVTGNKSLLTNKSYDNFEFASQVTNLASNMSELFSLKNTVDDILMDDAENATVETKALSKILDSTFQEACSWVSCARMLNVHATMMIIIIIYMYVTLMFLICS